MAVVTSTGLVSAGVDDSFNSWTAVQNTGYTATQLLIGTTAKGTVTTGTYWKHSGFNIPPRSEILSAIITFMASSSGPGTPLTFKFQAIKKDGIWDASSYTGWRRVHGFDFKAILNAAGPTTLATTGVSTTIGIDHKMTVSPARQQQHAQSVIATASGTLSFGTVDLRRFGSPSGNMYLEVYSVPDTDTGIPGTLLATSNTVACSSISTSMVPVNFTFTGGDAISISSGTTYAVVVRSDFSADGTNYMKVGGDLAWPYGPYGDSGHANIYGQGSGFDEQNYPTDWAAYLEISPMSANNVQWATTTWTAWQQYPSPNLRRIVQEIVNDPSYVNDGVLGTMIWPVETVAGRTRAAQAYDWGGQQTPFEIIYRPPQRVFI